MTAATALLRCSHPLPTAAVTVLSCALALVAGHPPQAALHIALVVLTGQLGIGWLNDLLDAGRDARAGRRDKPLAVGAVSADLVRGALVAVTALTVPLSFTLGAAAGGAHLVLVAAGWAYDLGLKATALSWAPYALAFAALPAVVVLALPGSPAPAGWLVGAAALLAVGAHFLNVVPDIADDRTEGVRGLPQRAGAAASRALGGGFLAAACLALAAGPPGGMGAGQAAVLATAVLLAGGAGVTGRRPGSRLPFLCAVGVAGLAVLLLVAGGASLAAAP